MATKFHLNISLFQGHGWAPADAVTLHTKLDHVFLDNRIVSYTKFCRFWLNSMGRNIKQPGKFAGFSKKERHNSLAVFSILLFLIYLLIYLTGKADAESVKMGSCFTGNSFNFMHYIWKWITFNTQASSLAPTQEGVKIFSQTLLHDMRLEVYSRYVI